MQVFGNVGTTPERVISKSSQKAQYRFRLSENRKGGGEATWYSVILAKDSNPGLSKGAFCKVTGTLKVDSFISRDGKPASALVIIAFEAVQLKSADALLATRDANRQEQGKKEAVAA